MGWLGSWPAKGRGELASLILATLARTLAQESDRWFLWLSVAFAAALITGERSGTMDETNQACAIQRLRRGARTQALGD